MFLKVLRLVRDADPRSNWDTCLAFFQVIAEDLWLSILQYFSQKDGKKAHVILGELPCLWRACRALDRSGLDHIVQKMFSVFRGHVGTSFITVSATSGSAIGQRHGEWPTKLASRGIEGFAVGNRSCMTLGQGKPIPDWCLLRVTPTVICPCSRPTIVPLSFHQGPTKSSVNFPSGQSWISIHTNWLAFSKFKWLLLWLPGLGNRKQLRRCFWLVCWIQ